MICFLYWPQEILADLSDLCEHSLKNALAATVPHALVLQALEVKNDIENAGQRVKEEANGKFADMTVAKYGSVSDFHKVLLENKYQPPFFGYVWDDVFCA